MCSREAGGVAMLATDAAVAADNPIAAPTPGMANVRATTPAIMPAVFSALEMSASYRV
jgi:hypothetical protein